MSRKPTSGDDARDGDLDARGRDDLDDRDLDDRDLDGQREPFASSARPWKNISVAAAWVVPGFSLNRTIAVIIVLSSSLRTGSRAPGA